MAWTLAQVYSDKKQLARFRREKEVDVVGGTYLVWGPKGLAAGWLGLPVAAGAEPPAAAAPRAGPVDG